MEAADISDTHRSASSSKSKTHTKPPPSPPVHTPPPQTQPPPQSVTPPPQPPPPSPPRRGKIPTFGTASGDGTGGGGAREMLLWGGGARQWMLSKSNQYPKQKKILGNRKLDVGCLPSALLRVLLLLLLRSIRHRRRPLRTAAGPFKSSSRCE